MSPWINSEARAPTTVPAKGSAYHGACAVLLLSSIISPSLLLLQPSWFGRNRATRRRRHRNQTTRRQRQPWLQLGYCWLCPCSCSHLRLADRLRVCACERVCERMCGYWVHACIGVFVGCLLAACMFAHAPTHTTRTPHARACVCAPTHTLTGQGQGWR